MQKPNLFSFLNQFVKNHYRSGYQNQHWVQKEFNRDFINFDLDNYYLNLRDQIVQLLIKKNVITQPILLEDLHLHLANEWKAYGNDGIGKIGTLFYETNAKFKEVLHQFIYHVLYKKIIKKPFLFQVTPTFRVHCPGSSNAEFFPHYHTDLALGHPPYEMNLWIPLTAKRDGHGFYLASLNDSREIADYIDYDLPTLMNESVFREKDYLALCEPKLIPVEVEAGQGLLFDSRCFHTAMPIKDHTRISMDFRIVLEEDFLKADIVYENRGIRRQLKLLPGNYYYHATSAELDEVI
ncbi:MAG: hypothetical protein V4501_11910 [Pseudomonadota bacterium]